MKYVSSRNKNEIVESHNAIIQGLAKDGGLFTPENINIHINVDELTNLSCFFRRLYRRRNFFLRKSGI